jgi:hypothetical protein
MRNNDITGDVDETGVRGLQFLSGNQWNRARQKNYLPA